MQSKQTSLSMANKNQITEDQPCCEVHQSLRQRSVGDGVAARSSRGGREEPEQQLLPPSCRSLQHRWGIVKPHELAKQRRKGIIISIHLWNKLVFPVLKYCRKSLMESKLKSRFCILSVMRTRTPQNRKHFTLWWSSAPAKDLQGINVPF